jgi:long-chain acyl-CoA synthetase
MAAILQPEFFSYGTVGGVVPSIEIKLVSAPEAGYLVENSPPQGEVWIRGPSVTKGYCELSPSLILRPLSFCIKVKRDDLTAEAFDPDGWFKTGDIGQWNPDGTLNIIDRIKNLIKLSGGEYVALEKLESIYKSSPSVGNLCVHATSEATKPMAVRVL